MEHPTNNPFDLLAEPSPIPDPEYAKSLAYWTSVSATDNGMLGGYPQVSRIDLQGSTNFLSKLKSKMPMDRPWRGADCGAGIGRVTKGFLVKQCDIVDIVEPVKKFTDEIFGGDEFTEEIKEGRIGNIHNVGLEAWTPEAGVYALIWNQWCLGHLTDDDLVSYLRRCIKGIQPNGIIGVKENMSTTPLDQYDEQDSSVTRTDMSFRRIFEKAGLKVIKTEVQKGFPPSLGLFPVRMYALQPT